MREYLYRYGCDQCGSVTEAKASGLTRDIPRGWYEVDESEHEHHEFCCAMCAVLWIQKQIKVQEDESGKA